MQTADTGMPASGDNGALEPKAIGNDEKALYDRQIRLWGIEAQNRLRNSTVLLAGLTGCGCEVAKNLMLAGAKSLTLLDHQLVTDDDASAQFLINPHSVGQNRAEASRRRCQRLNPNVDLIIDTADVSTKEEEYFRKFDLVILIDQRYSLIEKVNDICHTANIRFEAGGVFGWIGYAFFDFVNYSFLIAKPKITLAGELDNDSITIDGPTSSKRARIDEEYSQLRKSGANVEESITVDDDEKIKIKFDFPIWRDAWNVDWTQKKLIRKVKRLLPRSYFPIKVLLKMKESGEKMEIDKFLDVWKEEVKNCNHIIDDSYICASNARLFFGAQLSPTCSIIGAYIAQEAVKALSQKDHPLRNVFLFSAYDTCGDVCLLPPIM